MLSCPSLPRGSRAKPFTDYDSRAGNASGSNGFVHLCCRKTSRPRSQPTYPRTITIQVSREDLSLSVPLLQRKSRRISVGIGGGWSEPLYPAKRLREPRMKQGAIPIPRVHACKVSLVPCHFDSIRSNIYTFLRFSERCLAFSPRGQVGCPFRESWPEFYGCTGPKLLNRVSNYLDIPPLFRAVPHFSLPLSLFVRVCRLINLYSLVAEAPVCRVSSLILSTNKRDRARYARKSTDCPFELSPVRLYAQETRTRLFQSFSRNLRELIVSSFVHFARRFVAAAQYYIKLN